MDNNAEPSYTHLGYRDDTEKVVMYKRRTNFVNVVFTNKDSKKWKNNETAKEELLHVFSFVNNFYYYFNCYNPMKNIIFLIF